jgi:hypothetical protein
MFLPMWSVAILAVFSLYTTLSFLAMALKGFGVMLPFPDRGFRIFVCKDPIAMETLADLLYREEFKAGWRLPSPNVQRILMQDRVTIINSVMPELQQQMGNPAAALAVVVENPAESAHRVASGLMAAGYSADYYRLNEIPGKAEAMYYVKSNAFPGWVLIFRWHMLRMGKPKIRIWKP